MTATPPPPKRQFICDTTIATLTNEKIAQELTDNSKCAARNDNEDNHGTSTNCEASAIKFSHDCKSASRRLMGIVIEIPCIAGSSSTPHFIVIDDGTGLIEIEFNGCSRNDLRIGDLVDCVGCLLPAAALHSESLSNENSSTTEHVSQIPRLVAKSVAIMKDQNAESLRQLEILCVASSPSPPLSDGIGNFYDSTLMAGSLMQSIGPFTTTTTTDATNTNNTENNNGNSQHSQCDSGRSSTNSNIIQIRKTTAFNLIKESASDGGISETDLALLLGIIDHNNALPLNRCTPPPPQQRRRRSNDLYHDNDSVRLGMQAVRSVLQQLQADGEIYQGHGGFYLPL